MSNNNDEFEMPAKDKKARALPPTEDKNEKGDGADGPKTEEKEKPKYSEEELLKVFDDIIFAGEYSEIVSLRNGKLKVGFRTRTAEEVEAITKQIDTTTANLVSTLNEKRQLLNLYYALTSYSGKDLSNLKIAEKTAFVGKLAAPVIGGLMVALAKFDEKVYLACREGEENF